MLEQKVFFAQDGNGAEDYSCKLLYMDIKIELENLSRYLGLPKLIRKHFEIVQKTVSRGDFGSIPLFPIEYHSLIPKLIKVIN